MKRYKNILMLIICTVAVLSIYLYDVIYKGTEYTEKRFKVLMILVSFAGVFVRSNRRFFKHWFKIYEVEYKEIIGNAFLDNRALKRQLLLGIHDYNNKKYNNAIKRLLKLCKKAQSKRDNAACMIFIALSFEDSGRLREGVAMYQKVLKLVPYEPTVNNNLAVIYQNHGDKEKALFHYDKAIRGNPRFAQAYYNRALLYFTYNEFDNTISDARKVIGIKNDNKEAALLLLKAYDLTGDQENAIKYYNKGLELGYDEEFLDEAILCARENYQKGR